MEFFLHRSLGQMQCASKNKNKLLCFVFEILSLTFRLRRVKVQNYLSNQCI